MGEWWDAAVAAAGEGPPADLPAAVTEELIALWSDLGEARRRAAGRSWSAECDGLVVRIVMLTRLTMATPWQWIPAPLLESGVYQGVLESAWHRIHPTGHRRDPQRGRGPAQGQPNCPPPSAAASDRGKLAVTADDAHTSWSSIMPSALAASSHTASATPRTECGSMSFFILVMPRGPAERGWPWRAGRRARGSTELADNAPSGPPEPTPRLASRVSAKSFGTATVLTRFVGTGAGHGPVCGPR